MLISGLRTFGWYWHGDGCCDGEGGHRQDGCDDGGELHLDIVDYGIV